MRELRIAVRSLARQPGTAVLAIVALALGIGLTTTMFSIVNGAVLRGLPFPSPLSHPAHGAVHHRRAGRLSTPRVHTFAGVPGDRQQLVRAAGRLPVPDSPTSSALRGCLSVIRAAAAHRQHLPSPESVPGAGAGLQGRGEQPRRRPRRDDRRQGLGRRLFAVAAGRGGASQVAGQRHGHDGGRGSCRRPSRSRATRTCGRRSSIDPLHTKFGEGPSSRDDRPAPNRAHRSRSGRRRDGPRCGVSSSRPTRTVTPAATPWR